MKNLHKTANTLHTLAPPHLGILDKGTFDDYYDLRCYLPPDELRAVIAYIWVQHSRVPTSTYRPLEIPSTPSAYLFLCHNAAFIHGVGFSTFQYDPTAAVTFAGIKFLPGGLSTFWEKPMHTLHQKHVPGAAIFPELTPQWLRTINDREDAQIVAKIEEMLLSKQSSISQKVRLAQDLLDYIAHDDPCGAAPARIAREFHMSIRGLELFFRNYIGVPLKHVAMRQRLLNAIARANTSPETTWTDVAADFGYSSQSHFSREFKATTGLSPSHYRQLHHAAQTPISPPVQEVAID